MARCRDVPHEARFHIGEIVRVRNGTRDPDYPGIPMGGWVGTIKEVESGRGQAHYYCVAWRRDTLAGIHPVFRKRCERDGLDYKQSYLADDDLEPYGGEPLSIEQPTSITTPRLSTGSQDDRIRMILGLTGDDPVPDVDPETLVAYWNYLRQHLSLPFEARLGPRHMTVSLGEIEVTKRNPNHRLIDDYLYWFWNRR